LSKVAENATVPITLPLRQGYGACATSLI